ncbi:spindle pole body interacting protein [Guyanagaster necrorhizus]|uniref:Spindle pole body interacting protein n=1 Tax=Guyanagaster necrorhizus TaxID=856835 RepID=A0A9P8ALD5_9AGAR|nr:spindle pole body interacting protein [Guyanagaster necrorhizus MCA 3950]KAG7439609.1 spindle pole body interacting protein [Guyanagaster necrorhizus MCA 3950]
MSCQGNHCSFVLLAEFHILEGAQLKYQFPQPLGVDESVLAMSMLPDGAEMQVDDWTVFFLNQTPFNTISPVVGLDSPDVKTVGLPGEEMSSQGDQPDLLCVLNLVRTKHDKSLNRGARVLALAICTRHPFIQIFKPVLLMALDDYLIDPSQDCLARLFDAVNSMDFSGAPILNRHEKMVMRFSERKDIFAEKFANIKNASSVSFGASGSRNPAHRTTPSAGSYSSFEEGIMMRTKEKERAADENRGREWENTVRPRDRTDTESTTGSSSQTRQSHTPPSDSSFTLGGSAVWVGEESGLENASAEGEDGAVASLANSSTLVGSSRKRRSTDASSASSLVGSTLRPPPLHPGHVPYDLRSSWTKDTHFFHTTVAYRDHQLPIRMPLSTFPEEVGDYSLITLIKVFGATVNGPLHPHLHTNGPQTHPIIVLFNALITGKRIIFLGHKRPAGEVSSFVLSACALASGCGAILRGFIERAFPYANLNNREEWESVPAYIAGVTNPIFEALGAWDLLLDIGTGTVTVAKDIHTNYPITSGSGFVAPFITRSGTLKAESSEEDYQKVPSKDKVDFVPKADHNTDTVFIEDIKSAIEYHYGESLVRARFTEYVGRFVRLASRYEEEATGITSIGYPSGPFMDGSASRHQLGSGIAFNDEALGHKELASNCHRVEAWKRTNSYKYYAMDFKKSLTTNPIKGFDVVHQIFRLRHAKRIPDSEVSLVMCALIENVKTYDQVVEFLSYLMPHSGGLLPLAFGLFHQKESIRDQTVDLFNQLRAYPVGVLFLQTLNHFQRYSYVRQAHMREKRIAEQQHDAKGTMAPLLLPPAVPSRTHSNTSVTSMHVNGAF